MAGLLLAAAAGLLAVHAPPTPPPPPTMSPPPTRPRPLQPLGSLFTTDDYPESAYAAEAEGDTYFTLIVDPRGRPSRCIVTRSSGHPDLDRATCSVLTARARFSPARDGRGRAVEGIVSTRVHWVMPPMDDYSLAFRPTWLLSEVSLTGDGALRCRDRLNAFEYRDDGEGCGAFGVEVDLPQMLRTLGPGGMMTLIVTVAPDGMAPPVGDGVVRGRPVRSGSVRLSVAPDGQVTDCRITSRPIPEDGLALPELGDLCHLPIFDSDRMFRADEWRRDVRGATVTMQLYVRGSAAARTP